MPSRRGGRKSRLRRPSWRTTAMFMVAGVHPEPAGGRSPGEGRREVAYLRDIAASVAQQG